MLCGKTISRSMRTSPVRKVSRPVSRYQRCFTFSVHFSMGWLIQRKQYTDNMSPNFAQLNFIASNHVKITTGEDFILLIILTPVPLQRESHIKTFTRWWNTNESIKHFENIIQDWIYTNKPQRIPSSDFKEFVHSIELQPNRHLHIPYTHTFWELRYIIPVRNRSHFQTIPFHFNRNCNLTNSFVVHSHKQ